MRQIKKGSTSRSVDLYIIDSTAGTPETGVLFNTAGIDLKYRRDLSAVVAITEVTLAALTTAYSSGGFLEIGNGVYRLDVPDAAFATGADHVTIFGTVTGMIVLPVTAQLVDYDPEDTVRLGLTALPNAAADAAGGLPISDAGGLDLDSIKTDTAATLVDTAVIGALGAGLTALATQASVNTIGTNVDAILVDTAVIGALGAGLTALATQTSVNTIGTNVDSILVDTAEIGVAGAGLTNINLPNQTMDIVGSITGNLSGSVGSVTGAVGSVAAGGIAATSFAAGAIDAASLAADASTEIKNAIFAATLTELAADPGASPELQKAIMLLYMAARNKRDTTATTDTISNNAGATVLTAAVSDDGTTFSKAKYA